MPKTKSAQQFETAIAIARRQAGGNVYAGLLLYRVKYYFSSQYKGKMLERDGRDWIAKSREDWAREAGALTEAEIKTARKLLGDREFILIEQKKLSYGHPKALWISLDVKALDAAPAPPNMVPDFTSAATQSFITPKLSPPQSTYKPEPLATLAEVLSPVDPDAALKG